MNIKESFVTKNPCYTCGKTITVKGLMLHSVGCPQPKASVFFGNWNKSDANVCVHAVVQEDGTVLQLLPWNRRGWHCGSGSKGSGNNTHIGVEMTEPSTIKYTGGSSYMDLNPTATKDFVLKTYQTAVELFAYLCKKYNLDPLADGVIISHSEGHKRGIASNHGDVEHIWNKQGLTMAQFRKDVKNAMGTANITTNTTATTVQNGSNSIKNGDTVTFTGGGVYKSSTAESATHTKNVTSTCKVTAVNAKGTHPYHLISQDGKGIYGWVNADSVKEVAKSTQNSTGGYRVKVTADVLNVRKGPGTNYGIATQVKQGEVYTIVAEEKNGSTTWGKLKSGVGYISLGYTKRV